MTRDLDREARDEWRAMKRARFNKIMLMRFFIAFILLMLLLCGAMTVSWVRARGNGCVDNVIACGQ